LHARYGWLGDEDDVRAVLSGLAVRDALPRMLRLQPKEEVLLLAGACMPLPCAPAATTSASGMSCWAAQRCKAQREDILGELGF